MCVRKIDSFWIKPVAPELPRQMDFELDLDIKGVVKTVSATYTLLDDWGLRFLDKEGEEVMCVPRKRTEVKNNQTALNRIKVVDLGHSRTTRSVRVRVVVTDSVGESRRIAYIRRVPDKPSNGGGA